MSKTLSSGFYTTNQAGELLNYSRQHISFLVRCGELDGQRFGRDVLVTQSSVAQYKKRYNGHRKTGPKPAKVTQKKIEPRPETTAFNIVSG